MARLIDANKVINAMQKCLDEEPDKRGSVAYFAFESIIECLKREPTVDAVEVVRCKDCKHSYDGVANLMCGRCGQNINGIRLGGVSVKEEHFCSYGERKDNGNE